MTNEYTHILPLEDGDVRSKFDELFSNSFYNFFFRWGVKKMTPIMNEKERLEAIDMFINASDKKETHQATYQLIEGIIQSSVNNFTIKGVENIDRSKSHLYIMTHQNIWADPFFTNYALMKNRLTTTQIALGNNMIDIKILGRKIMFMDTIMKGLNCVIVNRGNGFRRDLYRFSKVINKSMKQGISTLVALREGRSKDGEIKANPTVLKTFYMSQSKTKSITEFVQDYSIHPVNISYEIEPNAAYFAKVLEKRDKHKKSKFEDNLTAIKGIRGYKGNVNVTFGKEITGELDSLEEVANEITRELITNQKIWSTNQICYDLKNGLNPDIQTDDDQVFYESLLFSANKKILNRIIDYYSKPIEQKKSITVLNNV